MCVIYGSFTICSAQIIMDRIGLQFIAIYIVHQDRKHLWLFPVAFASVYPEQITINCIVENCAISIVHKTQLII